MKFVIMFTTTTAFTFARAYTDLLDYCRHREGEYFIRLHKSYVDLEYMLGAVPV
jgi:hypothetical protein